MFEQKSRIKELLLTTDGKCALTVLLPKSFLEHYDELKDKDLRIKLCQWKNKRSINANNYSWELTDKLSEKLVVSGLKLSKEECHAEMIFRYGQVMLDENGERVVYSTKQGIKMSDFFPYAKEIGESELNGEMFTHYLIYRGSKTYDSQEFSIFLSGIIAECKDLGIETATPEEINRMVSLIEQSKNV